MNLEEKQMALYAVLDCLGDIRAEQICDIEFNIQRDLGDIYDGNTVIDCEVLSETITLKIGVTRREKKFPRSALEVANILNQVQRL